MNDKANPDADAEKITTVGAAFEYVNNHAK